MVVSPTCLRNMYNVSPQPFLQKAAKAGKSLQWNRSSKEMSLISIQRSEPLNLAPRDVPGSAVEVGMSTDPAFVCRPRLFPCAPNNFAGKLSKDEKRAIWSCIFRKPFCKKWCGKLRLNVEKFEGQRGNSCGRVLRSCRDTFSRHLLKEAAAKVSKLLSGSIALKNEIFGATP